MEEILVQRAVKTTFQVLFDKSFCDGFPNVDAILNKFLFAGRRRSDLEEINDVIQ